MTSEFPRIKGLRGVAERRDRLDELAIDLPSDSEALPSPASPLAAAWPLAPGLVAANRWVVQPMEGWDALADGTPSELTYRRWRNFGRSGAGLVWGGEAAAVTPEGRANPNQLIVADDTAPALGSLRRALLAAATEAGNPTPVVGLQLTHSGRWSRPERAGRHPMIAYRHPILDTRADVIGDDAVLTDDAVDDLVHSFARAAALAQSEGFDFVDVKHCHGYLLHEFLTARRRSGRWGGPSLEERTRLIAQVVSAVRDAAPGLPIGVRLSLFDLVPHRRGRTGRGEPEPVALPYTDSFGVMIDDPTRPDLTEPLALVSRLPSLGVAMLNVSGGSPYYVAHAQRPAAFPAGDGYDPPEDPLVGVARLLDAARAAQRAAPDMPVVSSGWSYLQEYLPHVAQACVRNGWFGGVGIGRMVLAYPELPSDVLAGRPIHARRLCRTFSDCTTAPRAGLVSGCYPLDPFYRDLPDRAGVLAAKRARRSEHPR